MLFAAVYRRCQNSLGPGSLCFGAFRSSGAQLVLRTFRTQLHKGPCQIIGTKSPEFQTWAGSHWHAPQMGHWLYLQCEQDHFAWLANKKLWPKQEHGWRTTSSRNSWTRDWAGLRDQISEITGEICWGQGSSLRGLNMLETSRHFFYHFLTCSNYSVIRNWSSNCSSVNDLWHPYL